jgi:hypothetical protein
MKSILAVAIIIMTFAYLPSCRKTTLDRHRVNDSLKAAFNYKPGTYWIYKDSLTGRLDSFAVTSQTDDFSRLITSPNPDYLEEGIVIYITEYLYIHPL